MPSLRNQKLPLRLIILASLIAAPALYVAGLIHQLTPVAAVAIGLGAGGIALLIYALRGLPRGLASLCIIAVLSTSILTRLIYLRLIQFSGAGFNAEFFLHLGLGSVDAAWHMYGLWLAVGIIAAGFYLLIGCLLALRIPRPTLVLALAAPFIIFTSRTQLASSSRLLVALAKIPNYAELQKRW